MSGEPNTNEIARQLLISLSGLSDLAAGGVVIGGAQIQNTTVGVISVIDYGAPVDLYIPRVRARFQLRIMAPQDSPELIDRIGMLLTEYLHPTGDKYEIRRLITQPSTAETFLIHSTAVLHGGITSMSELKTFWEKNYVLEIVIGKEPVDAPS